MISQKKLSVGTLARLKKSLGRKSENAAGLNSHSDHGKNSFERKSLNNREKLERSSFSTGDLGKASNPRKDSRGRSSSSSFRLNRSFKFSDETKKEGETSSKDTFKCVSFSRTKPETHYTFERKELTHLEAIRYWVQPEEMEETTDRCWDIIDEKEEQVKQGSKATGLCTRGLERYISERKYGEAIHQKKRQDAYSAVLEWGKGMRPEEIARRYEVVSRKCMKKAVDYGRRDAEIAERILVKERSKWEQMKQKAADASVETSDEGSQGEQKTADAPCGTPEDGPRVLLSRSSRSLTESMYGKKKESPARNSSEAVDNSASKLDHPNQPTSDVVEEDSPKRMARRNSGPRPTRRSFSNGRRSKRSSSRPRRAKSTTEVASDSTTNIASPERQNRRISGSVDRPRSGSVERSRSRRAKSTTEVASDPITNIEPDRPGRRRSGSVDRSRSGSVDRPRRRSSSKPRRKKSADARAKSTEDVVPPSEAGSERRMKRSSSNLPRKMSMQCVSAAAKESKSIRKAKRSTKPKKSLSTNDIGILQGLGIRNGGRAHTIREMIKSNAVWEVKRQE